MVRVTLFFIFVAFCAPRLCEAARYAVIIGCNKGGGDVIPLKYAENDAQEFADILQSLGGFKPVNIRTVSGCDSTLLYRALFSIDSLMKHDKDPNSLFLFYYSGHADAGNLLLGNGRYPLERLHGTISSCAASVRIGIFDACYSGAITSFKGGKQTQPFFFQEQKNIEGQVIIASSAASEAAQESQTLKGSIFSHHWFNGLRGSADIAGSRQVTLNQAYQYAYRKTLETTALISGEIQHPVFKFDIHGQGDIILTSLEKASSKVVFDRTCEGKFLVLSDDYIEVFADFSKKSGSEAIVALRPGTYRIINALGKDVSTHSFSLNSSDSYRMNASRLVLAALTQSRIKGPVARSEQTPMQEESVPLSTHSWGAGVTGMLFFFDKEKASVFFPGLSFVNSWYSNGSIDLFLNFHWNFPGINALCLFGFDYYFMKRRLPFYFGLGAGPHYLERAGNDAKARPGLSLSPHFGLMIDLNRQTQLRMQVPYTVSGGMKIASSIGLELQCIFYGPYRDVKVLHF
jgi:hypothetical protein